jgi:ppGpp synthetase/RelA/SpoT-type nucleotidyltranferase/predicted transcriptional regulator
MTSKQKVVDLREIVGEGDFPCPTCGVIISPSDKSDEVYEIEDTTVKEESVENLILRCKKCNTQIKIIGFFTPPSRTEIERKYTPLIPLYKRLAEECCFILQKKLTENEIKIHTLTSRVKSLDSFYEKISRKKVDHPFEEIKDIAGVRIICLYRSDIDKIRDIILKEFVVTEMDIASRLKTPFGYMSDHYLIKLPTELKGARYDELKELSCEIQVRTILMHAWATVSHHLDYKKDIDIPSDLRKDFDALSGLFYVADSHFEMFKGNIQKLRDVLDQSIEKNRFDLKQEINLDSLRAYTEWKFPERQSSPIEDYSTLINLLRKSGYEKIEDINKGVELIKEENIKKSEKQQYGKIVYTKTEVILNAISLIDPKFRKFVAEYMMSKELREPKEPLSPKRRDRLYIISEVLKIAMEGITKSQIMYRTNLSFAQLDEYLSFLIRTKNIKEVIENGKEFYKTTLKGVKYLEAYEALTSILDREP